MTVVVTHSTPADGSFSSTGAAAWNADHTLSGVGTLAEQNANTVAITGGTINGTTVGDTTAAAGTFTTLTSNTRTNLSSAVNIRNGGTVTAITRTASGGPSYTTVPSVTVSAPTTSGGVQATASVTMFVASATVSGGGTGYTVGDVLSVTGGTLASGTPATLTVATLSGSAVATVTITNAASYTALPSNPVSVTGGTGSGATFTLGWGVNTIVVGTAGSGYVEQPTVTFSSGTAAAYATVGAIPTVRTLGSAISFATPSSEVFRIIDANPSAANYLSLESGGGGVIFRTAGVGTNLPIGYVTKGTGQHSFTTAGSATNVQMQVTHTASAVNYVQVTGAATTATPAISSQGSDTNIGLALRGKGSGFVSIGQDTTTQFAVSRTSSAVNYYLATGGVAGSAPSLSAFGSDTNIDLTLTPKGTGNVRFGTYTANMALTIQGYIEIKDSGGTVRRLAVIA